MFDCTSLGCSPFESSSLRLQPTATCCNGSSMRKSRSCYNLIQVTSTYKLFLFLWKLFLAGLEDLGGFHARDPFETFLGRGTASDSAAACAARGGTGSPNAGCAKATAGCAAPAVQGPPGVDRPRRQQGTSPETWKGAEALEEWKLRDEQDSRQSLHSDFDSSLITDEFCCVSIALAFFNCAPALSIPNQQESKCQPPQPCSQVYMFNRCQSWTALRVTQRSAEDRLLGSEEALLVALLASECAITQQRDIRKFTYIASFRTCARHTSGRHGT